MTNYKLIGLGTYKLQDETCTNIIKSGLEQGYRLIDTAQLYRNHTQVALGIKQSQVNREDIFICSKISNTNIKKLKISESIDQIKKELEINYLDLLLLHNPVKNYDTAWKELIYCQNFFDIKNIGVSNFEITHLENIMEKTMISPYLNQIELNLFNQQINLINFHKKNNIITQSHTTLTKGSLLDNQKLIKWSNQLTINPSELLFKFVLDQGIGILPRTTNLDHLKDNINLVNKPCIFTENFVYNNLDIIKEFNIGYKIY